MQVCNTPAIIHCIITIVYIDGQKIAKRLSANITKETSTAKKLLQEYNAAASVVKEAHIPICVEEVLLPDSDFWQPAVPSSSPLSWNTKKTSLVHIYLRNAVMKSYVFFRKKCRMFCYIAGNLKNC